MQSMIWFHEHFRNNKGLAWHKLFTHWEQYGISIKHVSHDTTSTEGGELLTLNNYATLLSFSSECHDTNVVLYDIS